MSAATKSEFQHPDDGWYHIEAKGEHRNGDVVQVIDDTACAAIVNRFNADAKAGLLKNGNELLIDHEHFSDQPDQETRAYGWLQELQQRSDGIYGRIRWSVTGKAAVDGGDYRFFSTEYETADLKPVSSGPQKVRPMRLAGLTLTNMPNNRGQRGITNRRLRPEATIITPAPASESVPFATSPQAASNNMNRENDFPGVRAFKVIVSILRSRTGSDYTTAFNRALKSNRDLLSTAYDSLKSSRNLDRLLNRMETRLGGSPVAITNRAADQISQLANRFIPAHAGLPTAAQFDILWRAAGSLAEIGVESKLINRQSVPDGVTEADWKRATSQAEDFFTALNVIELRPVDRGPKVKYLQNQPGAIVGLFKTAVRQLMGSPTPPSHPGGLTEREAFDWLRENEPVFWTMSVLSWTKNDTKPS